MPVYLTPVIGTGTEADPFRAPYLGDDPRIGWIHFGPPGTALGSAMLYVPVAVGDAGFDKIADEDVRETTPPATRTRIRNRLGVTTTKTNLRELLAELLMDLGAAGTRWGGIRGFPSRARNQHEIWLGALGRVWSEPVAPAPSTQSFIETWPTDSTTLSSGQDQVWTEVSNDAEVSGGVARAVTLGSGVQVRCSSVLDTSNQRHKADFALVNNASLNQVRVCVRYTDGDNHYRGALRRNNSVFLREIAKRVAGSQTIFTNNTTDPGASGNFEVIVDGSSVTLQLNGTTVLGPETDASPQLLTTFTGGIEFSVGGASADGTLDNHTIADVVAVGILRQMMAHA